MSIALALVIICCAHAQQKGSSYDLGEANRMGNR